LGVLVLLMRVPPHCFRLASLAENATAWWSVAHLTITNAKKDVWYNEGVALRYDI
jgi:hypothetical protein